MIKETGVTRRDRKWIVLLLVISLLAALGIFFYRTSWTHKGDTYAVITHDGKEITKIDLTRQENATFSLTDYGVEVPVHFEIKDHRIRFVNVVCPDKICEGYGFIYLPTQTAVCMPNRVAISVFEE